MANDIAAQLVKADNRVTAYKRHAHRYCAKQGIDPEEMVAVPHPTLAGVQTMMPQWYLVAERMLDLTLLLRSISEENAAQQAANESVGPKEAPGA